MAGGGPFPSLSDHSVSGGCRVGRGHPTPSPQQQGPLFLRPVCHFPTLPGCLASDYPGSVLAERSLQMAEEQDVPSVPWWLAWGRQVLSISTEQGVAHIGTWTQLWLHSCPCDCHPEDSGLGLLQWDPHDQSGLCRGWRAPSSAVARGGQQEVVFTLHDNGSAAAPQEANAWGPHPSSCWF